MSPYPFDVSDSAGISHDTLCTPPGNGSNGTHDAPVVLAGGCLEGLT